MYHNSVSINIINVPCNEKYRLALRQLFYNYIVIIMSSFLYVVCLFDLFEVLSAGFLFKPLMDRIDRLIPYDGAATARIEKLILWQRHC